ncbi:MAG: DUF4142 domain-containing protein [Dokdonella sp.]
MKISIIVTAIALSLSAACASANPTDNDFAIKATKDGNTEVAIGKIAQERGQNTSIRDFGMKMVADHTTAGNELKAAASSDNVMIPENAMTVDQSVVDKVSNLEGGAFDKAYAKMMVEDHKKAVALFKKESTSGTGELKAFAARTLPTLEMHLKMAMDLQTGDNTPTQQ